MAFLTNQISHLFIITTVSCYPARSFHLQFLKLFAFFEFFRKFLYRMKWHDRVALYRTVFVRFRKIVLATLNVVVMTEIINTVVPGQSLTRLPIFAIVREM